MTLCVHRIVSLAKGVIGKSVGSQAERGSMAGTCERHVLELAGAGDEEEDTRNDQRRAGFVTTMEDGTPVFAMSSWLDANDR